MLFLAKKFCLVSGSGIDKYEITSFDKSLIMAGVGNYNLVRVSSIIPPNAFPTTTIDIPYGSVLYTAYSVNITQKEELISSAVVVAVPLKSNDIGVIIEYSCRGNKNIALKKATELAEDAMQRRGINDFKLFFNGIEIQGKSGFYSTTFAAVALLE